MKKILIIFSILGIVSFFSIPQRKGDVIETLHNPIYISEIKENSLVLKSGKIINFQGLYKNIVFKAALSIVKY